MNVEYEENKWLYTITKVSFCFYDKFFFYYMVFIFHCLFLKAFIKLSALSKSEI